MAQVWLDIYFFSSLFINNSNRSHVKCVFFATILDDEVAGCKDIVPETTSSEEEQEFSSGFGPQRLSVDSPMDGRAMRRSSRGSFTRASLEDLLSIDPEAHQSSVWLGTEDGWWVNVCCIG